MYTITGSSNDYVAVYCATHRKQFHIIRPNHLQLQLQWRMVQFGFLSAYDLLDLYMYFKKVMQTDTTKVESVAKIIIFE